MLSLKIDSDLHLRILQPSDAQALEALREGYTAYRNEWLYRGSAAEFIREGLARYRQSEGLTIGFFEHGQPGGVIVASIDSGSRSVSIDYMLGNRYRGRGLATKGVARLLEHLFSDRGLLQAIISVDPLNQESCAVAERLGFRIAETLPNATDYGDGFGDLRRYVRTAAE